MVSPSGLAAVEFPLETIACPTCSEVKGEALWSSLCRLCIDRISCLVRGSCRCRNGRVNCLAKNVAIFSGCDIVRSEKVMGWFGS